MSEKSQFQLLKQRRFLPFFLTQFFGAFNDNVFKTALVMLVTYDVGLRAGFDEKMLVNVAAGIFILPFFLFSSLAGQYADKLEKSAMIEKIKLVEIILMILASVAFFIGSLYMLLLLLFLMGTQSTFFGPIKYGILPDHLNQDELIGGNGLIEMGTFIAILLGTILGGLLILADYGIVIVSLLIVLVSVSGYLSSRKIPRATGVAPDLEINFNIFSETANIIKKARAKPRVFLTIIGISWFWFYGATFLAQFPTFGKDILKSNEQVVTLLLCTFSVGIGVGSLLCNKLVKGVITARYVPIAAVMMTVFTIDLYFASSSLSSPLSNIFGDLYGVKDFISKAENLRVVIDLLGIAISGGVYIVPLYAIMQAESDPQERSRMVAANNILNSLFMVLSAGGSIFLLSLDFTLPEIFLTIGILNIFFAFYICQLLQKDEMPAMIQKIIKFLGGANNG